jgi:hypothetical protein
MEFRLADVRTAEDLHRVVLEHFGVSIARKALREHGHSAPFDYLVHTFFEGQGPAAGGGEAPADCIIWANRGGGKTYLGALATALDVLYKPGIQIRILAGSLEQASRMHEHLRGFFDRPSLGAELKGRITDRRIQLKNGSRVELLAQSQASVRGVRPQKLRCDEVELFDPEVWSAAQLTTRSLNIGGVLVRGAVEAFSTMHLPHGLMSRLIADSTPETRRVFRWGITDTLETCVDDTECVNCSLYDECRGSARTKDPGHFTVSDARRLKSRVSRQVWESEMMCLRPSRAHAVFPEFSRERHVLEALPEGAEGGLWVGGMDFGFRSPTVILWGVLDRGVLYIVDERVEAGVTLDAHIAAILGSTWPRPAWIGADPAGHSRNEQTGSSNIGALHRAGLPVRTRIARVKDGLNDLHSRMDPADKSPPSLRIHARCVKLIEAMERYHYDPDRPHSEDPVKDGPDHAVDALRYLVTNLDRAFASSTSDYA